MLSNYVSFIGTSSSVPRLVCRSRKFIVDGVVCPKIFFIHSITSQITTNWRTSRLDRTEIKYEKCVKCLDSRHNNFRSPKTFQFHSVLWWSVSILDREKNSYFPDVIMPRSRTGGEFRLSATVLKFMGARSCFWPKLISSKLSTLEKVSHVVHARVCRPNSKLKFINWLIEIQLCARKSHFQF